MKNNNEDSAVASANKYHEQQRLKQIDLLQELEAVLYKNQLDGKGVGNIYKTDEQKNVDKFYKNEILEPIARENQRKVDEGKLNNRLYGDLDQRLVELKKGIAPYVQQPTVVVPKSIAPLISWQFASPNLTQQRPATTQQLTATAQTQQRPATTQFATLEKTNATHKEGVMGWFASIGTKMQQKFASAKASVSEVISKLLRVKISDATIIRASGVKSVVNDRQFNSMY